jgi:hypothetical protein
LLPTLYGRVLVPKSVADELNQPRKPETVRLWIFPPPDWLEIVPASRQSLTHRHCHTSMLANATPFSLRWKSKRILCSWMNVKVSRRLRGLVSP